MQVITPKTEGKLHHARSAWCISFPSVFGVDTCINPKNITTIPYHFISTLLNVNFEFDVTVANDVAIDVAKCILPGKVMQWLPCLEVRTLTNENGRYTIKLNDFTINMMLPLLSLTINVMMHIIPFTINMIPIVLFTINMMPIPSLTINMMPIL